MTSALFGSVSDDDSDGGGIDESNDKAEEVTASLDVPSLAATSDREKPAAEIANAAEDDVVALPNFEEHSGDSQQEEDEGVPAESTVGSSGDPPATPKDYIDEKADDDVEE